MVKEGKVLEILDQYRIVANLGANYVKEGDRLIVYSLGKEIKNERGESLGKVEIVKAEVVVEHVQQEFSTCASPLVTEKLTETVPGSSPFTTALEAYLSAWGTRPTTRTSTVKCRDPLPLPESAPAVDRNIRVGDFVRKKFS